MNDEWLWFIKIPNHSALPWMFGAGLAAAIGCLVTGVLPSWCGFLIGFAAMGAIAGWAFVEPAAESAPNG